MDVLTAWSADSDRVPLADAIAKLETLSLSSVNRGKRNGATVVASVEQCVKAARKRLAQPGQDINQLATLVQSCLRVLEVSEEAASLKSLTFVYGVVRQLATCKAFSAAYEEAQRLYARLTQQYIGAVNASKRGKYISQDEVNLAIGAILTALLCWSEGEDTAVGKQHLECITMAENAGLWLRHFNEADALKHRRTLFKSLYRAAVKLAGNKNWQQLVATCETMLAVADVTDVAPSALQAIAKLAPHAPEAHAMSMLSAALDSGAVRHSMGTSCHGNQIASAVATLSAALPAAYALRKLVAAKVPADASLSSLLEVFAIDQAALLTLAGALDSVVDIVHIGIKASIANNTSADVFRGHTHSAAVALVTAARLRAAVVIGNSTHKDPLPVANVETVVARLVGWWWPDWQHSQQNPSVLSLQELTWVSSNIFNIGVDFLSEGHAAAALPMLRSALQLALTSAALASSSSMAVSAADSPEQPSNPLEEAHVVVKRISALSEALITSGAPPLEVVAAVDRAIGILLQVLPSGGIPRESIQMLASLAVKQRYQAAVRAIQAQEAASKRGGSARARSAKSATHTLLPLPSLAAAMEASTVDTQGGGVLDQIVHAELAAWGALCVNVSELIPETRNILLGQTTAAIKFALETMYPADQAPLQHARILLLLHSLNIPALHERLSVSHDVSFLHTAERTLHLIELCDEDDSEARSFLAFAQALSYLNDAQTLVEAAVAEQQRLHRAAQERLRGQPAEAHAEPFLNEAPMVPPLDHAAWIKLMPRLEAAVRTFEIAARAGAHVHGDVALSLASAAAELGTAAGLHGYVDAERQALAAVEAVSTRVNAAGGTSRLRSSALESCILPMPAFTTSAAEAEEADLALTLTGDRSSSTMLQRAELCMDAALHHARAGAPVKALHCAGEAHRLLMPTLRGGEEGRAAPARGRDASDDAGWWRLTSAYCKSLLLLGRLFEGAGMVEEAVQAFKEGERTAAAVGSLVLAAAFALHIANINSRSGQPTSAAAPLTRATAHLSAYPGTAAAASYCIALAAVIRGRLHFLEASVTEALLCVHEAMEALADCRDVASKIVKDGQHSYLGRVGGIAATLGDAHALRVDIMRSEGRARDEVYAAAIEGLNALHTGGGLCAAARTTLLVAAAEAGNLVPRCRANNMALPARLWVPGQFKQELCEITTSLANKKLSLQRLPCCSSSGSNAQRSRAANAAPNPPPTAWTDIATKWATCSSLWQAFLEAEQAPHMMRCVAGRLAPACAAAGHLNLAAALIIAAKGATLRAQHHLVMFTRAQQGRKRAQIGTTCKNNAAKISDAEEAMGLLEFGFDPEVIFRLAGPFDVAYTDDTTVASPTKMRSLAGKPTRASATSRQGQQRSTGGDPHLSEDEACILLERLDQQAALTLNNWMSALPQGTCVTSLCISPTGEDRILVTRLCAGGFTPVILEIQVQALGALELYHPIRALQLDDDEANKDESCTRNAHDTASEKRAMRSGADSSSSVASVLSEMQNVLHRSTRSMKDLATETKDEQRTWWQTRLDLDDDLGVLLNHLDGAWLGPWRCLLMGLPEEPAVAAEHAEHAQVAVQQIAEVAKRCADGGKSCRTPSEASSASDCGIEAHEREEEHRKVDCIQGAVKHLVRALLPLTGSMAPQELRRAAVLLCSCFAGHDAANDEAAIKDAMRILRSERAKTARVGMQTSNKPGTAVKKRPVARQVKFCLEDDEEEDEDEGSGNGCEDEGEAIIAFNPTTTRRRHVRDEPSSPPQTLRHATCATTTQTPGPGQALGHHKRNESTLARVSNRGSNLADAFEALAIETNDDGFGDEDAPPPATVIKPAKPPLAHPHPTPVPMSAARSTTRKHKSRLGLMATPAPKSTRKPLPPPQPSRDVQQDPVPRHLRVPATAPRAPRPYATPSAARTVPAPARPEPSNDALGPRMTPVVAVFDPALQSLPWESLPGLAGQRLYRHPSLPCAAAARRFSPPPLAVDPRSAFYALNPSGDLTVTQTTFESWFSGLGGWEGKAGSPPSAQELANALQTKELFVYCGHGGGDQYLPPARLRALPRCAATLLMGCSSGRLRGTPLSLSSYYEPTGAVLAYLLAGCPAAVANLWDVTDRDIDRFAQAVLTQWLSGAGADGVATGTMSGKDGKGRRGDKDVAAAVAAARSACRLPYLIGAAPVCYGVPTQVAVPSDR